MEHGLHLACEREEVKQAAAAVAASPYEAYGDSNYEPEVQPPPVAKARTQAKEEEAQAKEKEANVEEEQAKEANVEVEEGAPGLEATEFEDDFEDDFEDFDEDED